MKKILFLIFWMGIFFISPVAQARSVTDMAGRKVNIPERINRALTDRFASLIVFALDEKILCNATFRVSEEGKRFISKDYYSDKPLVESEAEEILKLHPDVILIADFGNSKSSADAMQKKLNIPVLMISIDIAHLRDVFVFLGEVLERDSAAKNITGWFDACLIPLSDRFAAVPKSERPAIYYAEGPYGLNTEPAASIHSQVMDFLHIENVAKAKLGGMHGMSEVSMEQVLLWNPGVVLVWSGFPSGIGLPGNDKRKSTRDHILANAAWANVKAVKEKRVYQIPSLPFGWFDRPPSSNCIAGALWLANTLYPSSGFDFDAALKDYFRLFYHVDITDEDIATLLSN
jgi:iron complex transport system substrate-binding protein